MGCPTSAYVSVNDSIKTKVGYQKTTKVRKNSGACLFSHLVGFLLVALLIIVHISS